MHQELAWVTVKLDPPRDRPTEVQILPVDRHHKVAVTAVSPVLPPGVANDDVLIHVALVIRCGVVTHGNDDVVGCRAVGASGRVQVRLHR